MAGLIPSMLTGSMVVLRIGDAKIAYCQNLRFQRNVAHAPIVGVGSYSVHALEPVDYSAGGSMTILRYTTDILFGSPDETTLPGRRDLLWGATIPENLRSAQQDYRRNGNSMIDSLSFNPAKLLLSHTFDIDVYEKSTIPATGEIISEGTKLFTFLDCRLTGYSFDFIPGSLLTENVDFVCRNIIDRIAYGDTTEVPEEGIDKIKVV